jgi:hypothetical protein
MLLVSALTQHCADSVVTCIAHDLEWKIPIWWLHDGCGHQCLLKGVEGYEAILIEVEWDLFGKKTCQRLGYMGEVLDEPPIKACVL